VTLRLLHSLVVRCVITLLPSVSSAAAQEEALHGACGKVFDQRICGGVVTSAPFVSPKLHSASPQKDRAPLPTYAHLSRLIAISCHASRSLRQPRWLSTSTGLTEDSCVNTFCNPFAVTRASSVVLSANSVFTTLWRSFASLLRPCGYQYRAGVCKQTNRAAPVRAERQWQAETASRARQGAAFWSRGPQTCVVDWAPTANTHLPSVGDMGSCLSKAEPDAGKVASKANGAHHREAPATKLRPQAADKAGAAVVADTHPQSTAQPNATFAEATAPAADAAPATDAAPAEPAAKAAADDAGNPGAASAAQTAVLDGSPYHSSQFGPPRPAFQV
jgi:hypothetical protein